MKRIVRYLVLVSLFIEAIPCSAAVLQWNWLNPLPTGNTLSRIIWTGKSLYACGAAGTIISSSDGTTWHTPATGVTDQLIDVVSTGSRLIAVGRSGTIICSENGAVWTTLTVIDQVFFTSMVYTGEKLLAGGADGTMYTSQGDFSIWTRQNTGTTKPISSMIYKNKEILAILDCDTLLRSVDGIAWKMEPFTRPECLNTAFTLDTMMYGFTWGQQFVSSQDGLGWSSEPFGGQGKVSWVFPSGDLLVATTDAGSMYVRKPDKSWLRVSVDSVRSNLNSGTGFNGGSFLIGENGAMTVIDSAMKFQDKSPGLRNTLYSLYQDERGYFAAGSEGTIVRSVDRKQWTPIQTPTTETIMSIASSKSTMVACGKGATILTSPDGNSWTSHRIDDSVELRSVACNGKRFVIAGRYARLFYSDNGSQWQKATHDAVSSFWSVIWDGMRFVAVGEWGSIHSSPDGINWTQQPTDEEGRLRSIAWTGSRYIVTGDYGTILTSENGSSWKTRNSLTDETLICVRWTGSRAIAIGTGGILIHSPDGLTWSVCETNVAGALSSLIAASGHLVAVGNWGAIVEADEADFFPSAVLPINREAAKGVPAIGVRNGKIMVTMSGMHDAVAHIAVFSLQGRLVVRRDLSRAPKNQGTSYLSIGDIPPGIYLAEVRNGQTISRVKLMLGKQH